mmetsp:Transcript_17453/g.49540  ORF Transcript_17453/g.49540 Transcript_17453/m.49540 type:complete len:278 (-) Transcript_17453:49-882(-)
MARASQQLPDVAESLPTTHTISSVDRPASTASAARLQRETLYLKAAVMALSALSIVLTATLVCAVLIATRLLVHSSPLSLSLSPLSSAHPGSPALLSVTAFLSRPLHAFERLETILIPRAPMAQHTSTNTQRATATMGTGTKTSPSAEAAALSMLFRIESMVEYSGGRYELQLTGGYTLNLTRWGYRLTDARQALIASHTFDGGGEHRRPHRRGRQLRGGGEAVDTTRDSLVIYGVRSLGAGSGDGRTRQHSGNRNRNRGGGPSRGGTGGRGRRGSQ